MLVIKDQIGHFVKPLDVFGNTPNLRVGYCNLPYIYIYISEESGYENTTNKQGPITNSS